MHILRTTMRAVASALGDTEIVLRVHDASTPELIDDTARIFSEADLDVRYERRAQALTTSYLELLAASSKYAYVQFDDQLTVGLSPELLSDAARLLESFDGVVPVVSILWPLRVEVDDVARVIRVVTHREAGSGDNTRYGFWDGKLRSPVTVQQVGGHRFGIFENPTYGFYFNHLIVPSADYRARLLWYVDHVSADAHDIELAAAAKSLGPFWRHIAVCLDGVALLDLDFAHTPNSVRPVGATAAHVHRGLELGYDVEARVERNGRSEVAATTS